MSHLNQIMEVIAAIYLAVLAFYLGDLTVQRIKNRWALKKLNAEHTRLTQERDALILQIPKARVIKVGELTHTGATIFIEGWIFDCQGRAVAHAMLPDGTQLYCGYSKRELIEIDRRRAEFEE